MHVYAHVHAFVCVYVCLLAYVTSCSMHLGYGSGLQGRCAACMCMHVCMLVLALVASCNMHPGHGLQEGVLHARV